MAPVPFRRRLTALRWLCRAVSPLVPAGAARSGLPAPGQWPMVVALADQHLLLPELSLAIERHGLAGAVPADVVEALAAVHELNRLRNGWLRDQMRDLCAGFAADGIAPVWLKGAAELLEPGWERSGRMMNDLDLWVPDPAHQRAALARLDRLGYRIMPGESDAAWEEEHHYAGRFHESWPVRVELHRSVIDPADRALLPDDEARRDAVWLDWNGLRVGRLGARHRVLHALVQTTTMAVPPLASGRTPLMKGLEVARRLAADFDGTLPPDLRADLAGPAWAAVAPPFLTLAEALFALPNPLPADRSALRRLETVTAAPRLDFLRETAGRMVSRRMLDKLLHPATIPEAVARCLRALATGRDRGY